MAFSTVPLRIHIFRCENIKDSEAIRKDCNTLCKRATYTKCAKREEAPDRADCLTSIHYLFHNHTYFLLDWIGNMPRNLSKQRTWKYLQIPPEKLELGDLLFLKHKKSHRLVTHVAMALNSQQLFHCSSKKGALIESISEVFSLYSQSHIKAMLSYIDPRTEKLYWIKIKERCLQILQQLGSIFETRTLANRIFGKAVPI